MFTRHLAIQREVLQMHVGIPRDPRKHDLIPKVDLIQQGGCRESPDGLVDLFVRTFVFVLGQTPGQLAHIFHG